MVAYLLVSLYEQSTCKLDRRDVDAGPAGAVIRKAAALLPENVGHRLLALLSPKSLAVMAGIIVIWAGAHFAGIGELADVVLLVAGWISVGSGAVAGARKLIAFAIATASARSTTDLDKAARDLADAITTLGFDVALGLLFRGKPETTFKEPYRPDIAFPAYGQFARVMPKGGPTRMYEAKLFFTRTRDAGRAGTAPVDNLATVGRGYYPEAKSASDAAREVRGAVYHERVHQRLTQGFSLLGRPAIYIKMGAYKRSYILRYIEEAAAEAYRLRKIGGARPGELSAIEFPLNGNYGITLARMGEEAKGILLGPVTVANIALNATYGALDEHC